MGIEFPSHFVGISFLHNDMGMKFRHNYVGISFPCYCVGTAICGNKRYQFLKSVVATEFPKRLKELINLYSYALQFQRYSMGMKFPCHCVGIPFPCHYVGMKFPQNGVGIKFPQTIRWNCILFIILPPGHMQANFIPVSQPAGLRTDFMSTEPVLIEGKKNQLS